MQCERKLDKLFRQKHCSIATSTATAVTSSTAATTSTAIKATAAVTTSTAVVATTVTTSTAVVATAVVAATVMTTVMAMTSVFITAGVANVGRPAARWVVVPRAGAAVLEVAPFAFFVLHGGSRVVLFRAAVPAKEAGEQHCHYHHSPNNDGDYS